MEYRTWVNETGGVYSRQMCRLRLKCDGTRTESGFRLPAKQISPFKSLGAFSPVDYWQPSCVHHR
jgi:hypothetical protein